MHWQLVISRRCYGQCKKLMQTWARKSACSPGQSFGAKQTKGSLFLPTAVGLPVRQLRFLNLTSLFGECENCFRDQAPPSFNLEFREDWVYCHSDVHCLQSGMESFKSFYILAALYKAISCRLLYKLCSRASPSAWPPKDLSLDRKHHLSLHWMGMRKKPCCGVLEDHSLRNGPQLMPLTLGRSTSMRTFTSAVVTESSISERTPLHRVGFIAWSAHIHCTL